MFRGDSALSTWLYRIAVNTVLMRFHKKALPKVSLDEPYNKEAHIVGREIWRQGRSSRRFGGSNCLDPGDRRTTCGIQDDISSA
jgi:hypothetical protein